ncbi:unnamed protein product, partial [Rotaria sordida]
YYTLDSDTIITACLPQWLDINGHCYRISDDRKTIQEARNSCITLPKADKNSSHLDIISIFDDYANENDDMKETFSKYKNHLIDIFKGEIAQYTLPWQARLGFFLLDTNASNTESELKQFESISLYMKDVPSLVSNVDVNLSSINEFQMINSNDDNSLSIKDDSCLLWTRSIIDEKQRSSILEKVQINNCSKPRHVLCRTKTIVGFNSPQICYTKPSTLGLPIMISNHLTYELCSSVCQTLKTNLAVINMNKCYCFDATFWNILDPKRDRAKYETKDCGNPCPGNQNEHCGNTDTIVVLYVAENLSAWRYHEHYKYTRPYPSFVYDGCIHLNSVNQSKIYQFNLNHINDIQPRHCLELCKKYKQQYALLNSNKCLCTNILMRKKQDDRFSPPDFNCTQECQDFQLSNDKQRCVQRDFLVKKNSSSTAQSYCKSIGGVLAKINDILEIQDIIPELTLTTNYFNQFSFSCTSNTINMTKYFWIDRTSDIINNNKILDHSIRKCFQTSKSIDQNCIVLRREKILIDNTLTFQRCFSESDQCSSMSATPVCVDKNPEVDSIVIPSSINSKPAVISVNVSIDYSCGNDLDYHLINGYCYKVLFHETTWNEAKVECERDSATLFLPEKSTIFSLLKLLFLRRHSYTSSGIAHIDIFYDNQNRTTMQHNTISGSIVISRSYFDDFHNLCKRTIYQRDARLMSPSTSSKNEKSQVKIQQTSCAYVDFRSEYEIMISCNEISCNRPATVICQKTPIITTHAVLAEWLVINN